MRLAFALAGIGAVLGLVGCSAAEESPQTALGAPAPAVQVWPRAEVERDLSLSLTRITGGPFEPGVDPQLRVSLTNRSHDRAYPIVLVRDGSEMGWGEPYAWFDVTVRRPGEAWRPAPFLRYMRCGNYYEDDWRKDVVLLQPGRSALMPDMPFYFHAEYDDATETRIVARYSYGDEAKDPLHVPPALHVMPAYALESAPLVLQIERPLTLKLELLGKLPRSSGQPLSAILSLTATNVSTHPVPFASWSSGALVGFEVQLVSDPNGYGLSVEELSPTRDATEQLAPGESRQVLDVPLTTDESWELGPNQVRRRIRAAMDISSNGLHRAASPWVDL